MEGADHHLRRRAGISRSVKRAGAAWRQHEQQQQRAVLVCEQLPVDGLVPRAADVTLPLEQRPQLTKILQALDILFTDWAPLKFAAPRPTNMRDHFQSRKSK
jgi:hypothetical protein